MSATQREPSVISRAIGPVARELLGEPNENLSTDDDLKFGTRGSVSVNLRKGTWFDHEADQGGGVLDLVMTRRHADKDVALAWLRERGHVPKPSGPNIVQTYPYTDENGQLVFEVCRLDPKDFRQRRPDGAGGWVWKMAGVRNLVYRLPEVLAAIRAKSIIYIAEGEKAVNALAKLGLTATCSPAGAKKWRREHSAFMTGADLVILPDNDVPGQEHAAVVAAGVRGKAARVRVLNLPDLPPKGDVFDWITAGGTAEQLMAMANAALAPTDLELPQPTARADRDDNGVIVGLNGQQLTEDGIALAFTQAHQDTLRYDHTCGSWYYWTGKAWRPDETKKAFSWSRSICRKLAKEAGVEGKLLATMAKAATAAAVERFAQSDPLLSVTSAIWDRDAFLLGTPGGTIDLKTGKLRDPVPEDHITKLTAVTPAATADCPMWLGFLAQATNGDAEMVRFLRQWCGYCLTGDTREHALLFAHGPGGNGKGVFQNTTANIMGDYARTAAMDTFTASSSDRHPTDLAMLRGARLVTASETEEGRAWAEARIKALTGGDKISARFMRRDFFEFQPEFKLTIIGNHKPLLRNVDDAARRRFNVAPFVYKPQVVDRQLEVKLQKEWSGILRWMIEGCLDWHQNGLVRPKVITDATADYFLEQDTVHQWIEDTCEIGAGKFDTLATLFKSWTEYALANGEKTGTTKWFSQTIAKQGCQPVKNTPGEHGKRGYLGISVKRVASPPKQESREAAHDWGDDRIY